MQAQVSHVACIRGKKSQVGGLKTEALTLHWHQIIFVHIVPQGGEYKVILSPPICLLSACVKGAFEMTKILAATTENVTGAGLNF